MGAERAALTVARDLHLEKLPAVEEAGSAAARLFEDTLPKKRDRLAKTTSGDDTNSQLDALNEPGSLSTMPKRIVERIQRTLEFWHPDTGNSPGEIKSVRREIADHAKAPLPVLTDAMKEHRILAFGESHEDGAHRTTGAALMAHFRENGGTHLALEIPKNAQTMVDQFASSGEATHLKAISATFVQPDYLQMLQNARASGMKLVAVDSPLDAAGKYAGNRDLAMAENISAILDADQNSKVVFWAGGAHVEKHGERAAGYLSRAYPTFSVENMGSMWNLSPLRLMTPDISASTLVRPADSPLISSIKAWTYNSNYSAWDAVLLHKD